MSNQGSIAYFCMEYGLDASFPIYSGGLGILAGDHMKSVGDLRLPVIGIGLFWSEGYTKQIVNDAGQLEDLYPATTREFVRKLDVQIEVTVKGKVIPCQAFKVERFVKSELYLLEPVHEADRWITKRLYGGDEIDRLAQEVVLGVGGVRLMAALGKTIQTYHFNEGHAVFAGLELLRAQAFGGGTFAERVDKLRPHVVFTTHTPVPAGNEVHGLAVMREVGADCGFTDAELTSLAGDPFSMTVAGLRMARIANGVAQLHGETARTMWKDVTGAAPIIAITNGVHVPTWQDARIRAALAPQKARAAQDAALLTAHAQMKQELCDEIATRTGKVLNPKALIIGFARRAASYKRADLILSDEVALGQLLAKGVQIVYSGKAHPRDTGGKAIVGKLVEAAKRYPGAVVFLQNYDMTLGAMLTRGCDVWLNNPRRPLEASGTSGMKAAMNGVPNVSILDGWWPEGCVHGKTGWQIGDVDARDNAFDDVDAQRIDARDRAQLFRVLTEQVLPAYAQPAAWVEIMRASIEMSAWPFSSDRMVEDYARMVYSR